MRAVIVSLAFTAVVVSAPVPKELKKKADAALLVGVWETVVSEENGRARANAGVYRWTFDADLNLVSHPTGQGERGTKWAVKIAPGETPKEIDLSNGGTAHKGIYEWDGDDLRIAYTPGTRPTSFDPKPGVYYNVLRRVPEKK